MSITVTSTAIPDVLIIEPKVFGDERGWFFESFNEKDFSAAIGRDISFVQDNHSSSKKGVLRGLHYQLEQPQAKLVRVVRGAVFDVVVDLRQSSSNFGQWFGLELSSDNKKQLWIPKGFAHGFLVLSDEAAIIYKATDYWHAATECCLAWDDPTINIRWPKVIGVSDFPLLSPKDQIGLMWNECPKQV
jgi:dTDP-4-dehydrorhamnose 3,5-epimerase